MEDRVDVSEFLKNFKIGTIIRDSYPASMRYNELYQITDIEESTGTFYIQSLKKQDLILPINYGQFLNLMYKLSPIGTILYGNKE